MDCTRCAGRQRLKKWKLQLASGNRTPKYQKHSKSGQFRVLYSIGKGNTQNTILGLRSKVQNLVQYSDVIKKLDTVKPVLRRLRSKFVTDRQTNSHPINVILVLSCHPGNMATFFPVYSFHSFYTLYWSTDQHNNTIAMPNHSKSELFKMVASLDRL